MFSANILFQHGNNLKEHNKWRTLSNLPMEALDKVIIKYGEISGTGFRCLLKFLVF